MRLSVDGNFFDNRIDRTGLNDSAPGLRFKNIPSHILRIDASLKSKGPLSTGRWAQDL